MAFLLSRKKMFLLCALALFLIGMGPTLVAHSPLKNRLLRWVLPGLNGSITVGRTSVGWFSPIVLEDAVIRDAAGRPLLIAQKIESRESLLRRLRDTSDLGKFRFERPVIRLICSGQQTNLEQVFAKWIAKSDATVKDPGPRKQAEVSRPLALAVELVDGSLIL